LASDKSLRTAIVDSGTSNADRERLVRDVFSSSVGALALEFVIAASSRRWSSEDDLVEAVEIIGAQVVFASADAEGAMDRVEEEIFLFDRAVDANPELQMTLTNPALSGAAKSAVVSDLLAGRAAVGTTLLLIHTAANLRGRRVDTALASLSDIAAAQRNRVVAHVRVAQPLTADQATRLSAALGRLADRNVTLNVVIDPSVVGGVSVRLGGDVIDGSISNRLEQARRSLVG
jgi:F-type H+-transporting ATPase subunit delta